jgi:exopolysaccharide production protein ExoZ
MVIVISMATTNLSKTQNFRSIQYLRALAAIMVATFHIFGNLKFMDADVNSVLWMQGGVDIFFVISGFVMVQSTSGRVISPKAFITQRIQRIVPLYWIATAIMMIQISGQWELKLKSLFFIPAINPQINMVQPILQPGWTLNYEMFFYAIFACTLLLKESYRFVAIVSVFVLLLTIGQAVKGSIFLEFYCCPIIAEFLMGMAIAKFGIRLPTIALPFGFAIMIALQSMGIDRVYSLGIPAMIIVSSALSAEHRLPTWKFADFLGSASYSIYLFHLMALGLIAEVWPYTGLGKEIFVISAVAFMILIGCVMYRTVEQPIIAFFASRRSNDKSGVTAHRDSNGAPVLADSRLPLSVSTNCPATSVFQAPNSRP